MPHPDARISATTKVQIQSHPGERWTVSCCALNKRDGRSLTSELALFWHFSIIASSLPSASLTAGHYPQHSTLHTPRHPRRHPPGPAGAGRADPPPLATAWHQPSNCQRLTGTRSRRAALLFQYVTGRTNPSDKSRL